MKIADLKVGEKCTISLVVRSAIAKETKAGKPYLSLEFFDGKDAISGNYWDWTSGNIPAVNTILAVTGQVTEWQGVKQLNVKAMSVDTAKHLAEFTPTSDYDISEIYKASYALMSDVMDEDLRCLALAILEELKNLWLTVPGAIKVHHNYIGGTLVHSYNVAVKAKALAEVTEGANVDVAVVGGMLHDLGKLFTYRLEGATIDKTANGNLYDHIFMGAEFVGNFAEDHVDTDNPYTYGKVRLIRHIILSHHGKLEYGSPVTPMCIEAYIVHFADDLDATAEQIRTATKEGSNWTDKLWTLGGCPQLTMKYTADLMKGETEE